MFTRVVSAQLLRFGEAFQCLVEFTFFVQHTTSVDERVGIVVVALIDVPLREQR